MNSDVSSVTLSQELFDRFWRALVSKRKARRLEVDRESVWQQLGRSGVDAEFLRAGAKNVKRDSQAEASTEGLVAEAPAKAPKVAQEPRRKRVIAKPPRALAAKASKGSMRKAGTKSATGKRRTTAATRPGERRAGKQ